MTRVITITVVSVALCLQLVWLPTRGFITQYFGKDRPFLKLPIASNGGRFGCHSRGVTEISFNKQGKWVARGELAMSDQQVTQYLHAVASRIKSRGYTPIIRLRIPAKAPAKHFIKMTHFAEKAGIENILVSVWQPNPYCWP